MSKLMTKSMGGEVVSFIEEWEGDALNCFGPCKKDQYLNEFYGYEHSGGLKDSSGKRWWVYFQCPECGYQHSFNKMKWFMERSEDEENANR